MSPLSLSPCKKSTYKYFITRRLHRSRSFEIFESMEEIFYLIEVLNFEIGGDRVENVPWQTKNLLMPP